MSLRWTLAMLHLMALGIGVGAIWARARWLARAADDRAALDRALIADAWWGGAFLLWASTGLWRLFGAMEKDAAYYYGNHLFWGKMGLLGLILVLELLPLVTLMRWRRVPRAELPSDVTRAPGLAMTSYVQLALLSGMVAAATGRARGHGV